MVFKQLLQMISLKVKIYKDLKQKYSFMKKKSKKRCYEASPDFTIIEDIDLYENEFTFSCQEMDDYYEEVIVSSNTFEVNIENVQERNRISVQYNSLTCDDYEFIEYIEK